ncbi:polysaccharide deacetylase family protein [Thermanaerothrix daxensis]|nr:polysaccharide deacetylase family protein [Thermanaerothrix daxensis]
MRAVSLTFDDCYDYALLSCMENFLDDHPNVKVTFFPTGIALIQTSLKDPCIWKRFLIKGHEIGYHGYNHDMPSTMDLRQSTIDFEKWQETLTDVLGTATNVRFARPPYGDISYNFLRVCCENNLIVVMWSANWSTSHLTDYREVYFAQGGDIVLFHVRAQDVQNFQSVLPILQNRSLDAVCLSDLLLDQEAKLDIHPASREIEYETSSSSNRKARTWVR